MYNLKIGCVVKIISIGGTYVEYGYVFEQLNFHNKTINGCWKDGEIGVVFGIMEHPERDTTLVALRHDDGRECLMCIRYLEYISGRKQFKLKRNENS